MHTFKLFLKILYQHRLSVILYFVCFAGLSFLVAKQNRIGDVETTFEATSISFSVFDEDNSELSKGLVDCLSTDNKIVEIEDDKEVIQNALYNRDTMFVMRIQRGFGKSLKANDNTNEPKILVNSVKGSIYAKIFQNKIDQYISIISGYLQGGYSDTKSIDMAVETMDEDIGMTMENNNKKESYSDLYYMVLYLPYIFISVCVCGIGPMLFAFYKENVYNRVKCSSCPSYKLTRGAILGVATVGAMFCVISIIVAFVGAGTQLFTIKGCYVIINVISFLLVAMSLTFLAGYIIEKEETLSLFSNIIGLGMSFLGGVFVPLEYLGENVVRIAKFLPSYWYVIALREIDDIHEGSLSLSGEGWLAIVIQLLFAMALTCVALAYNRVKSSGRKKAYV